MRFVLVDKILELVPLQSIVASRQVLDNEDYFLDHFPGFPVVPGVLLVEMIAQTAGKCLMAGIDPSQWPVLVQIVRANFRQVVRPGAGLLIKADIKTFTVSTATAKGSIFHEDRLMADAEVVFGFISKSLIQPGYQDEVYQEFLQRNSH